MMIVAMLATINDIDYDDERNRKFLHITKLQCGTVFEEK